VLGFDEENAGRLALVVTEAATNLVRHGGGGEILLHRPPDAPDSIDVLALDRGPGIASVERSLADGYSSAGGTGIGLGAVVRLSTRFDVYAPAGRGTAIIARVGPTVRGRGTASRVVASGVSVPKRGEPVCGDAWAIEHHIDGAAAIVLDGLGHGAGAAEAACEGIRVFAKLRDQTAPARLEAVHDALRPTRGAAVAIAVIDAERGVARFAGLGNIAGLIHADGATRHAGATLVMHSDGIATLPALDSYPGLLGRDPGLIAGVLYRDHQRQRDDATVVVMRERTA
jgi:anti-sigma regulatory factor (Ser/Thr protein kinase)